MRKRTWFSYRTPHPSEYAVPGDLRVLRYCAAPRVPPRDILVWVPPEVGKGDRRFPAIYMQDGRAMFDPATSLAGSWHVGETMEALRAEGIEAIVVAIPNADAQRATEYTPYRGPCVDEEIRGRPGGGDTYLDFVVDVVKPLVDSSFPTLQGPEATGIIGSSLGGLISLYAFFTRTDVFGFAGAMSPGIPSSQSALFELVGRGRAPRGRLYLDVGVHEGAILQDPQAGAALSRSFLECVDRLHRLLVAEGYRDGHDLLVVTDEQATHEEAAWARRLPDALRFLLGR